MSTHNLCFGAKIRKIDIPQFYSIKVGYKRVFITRTCFPDDMVFGETYETLSRSKSTFNCSLNGIQHSCIFWFAFSFKPGFPFKFSLVSLSELWTIRTLANKALVNLDLDHKSESE